MNTPSPDSQPPMEEVEQLLEELAGDLDLTLGDELLSIGLLKEHTEKALQRAHAALGAARVESDGWPQDEDEKLYLQQDLDGLIEESQSLLRFARNHSDDRALLSLSERLAAFIGRMYQLQTDVGVLAPPPEQPQPQAGNGMREPFTQEWPEEPPHPTEWWVLRAGCEWGASLLQAQEAENHLRNLLDAFQSRQRALLSLNPEQTTVALRLSEATLQDIEAKRAQVEASYRKAMKELASSEAALQDTEKKRAEEEVSRRQAVDELARVKAARQEELAHRKAIRYSLEALLEKPCATAEDYALHFGIEFKRGIPRQTIYNHLKTIQENYKGTTLGNGLKEGREWCVKQQHIKQVGKLIGRGLRSKKSRHSEKSRRYSKSAPGTVSGALELGPASLSLYTAGSRKLAGLE